MCMGFLKEFLGGKRPAEFFCIAMILGFPRHLLRQRRIPRARRLEGMKKRERARRERILNLTLRITIQPPLPTMCKCSRSPEKTKQMKTERAALFRLETR